MKINSRPLDDKDLHGCIIVMKEKVLRPEYRTLPNRFYRATGGFGCSPVSAGRAVFTKEMFGGKGERWQRYDFEGWMTDEEFTKFCEENGLVLTWEILSDGKVPNL